MDSYASPDAAAPVSNGRACTNCARAKAKCIVSQGHGKCERCNRLNRECQLPVPARRRRAVKKLPAGKTARIEEKLDGLVNLLKSAAQSAGITSDNSSRSVVSAEVQTSREALTSFISGVRDNRDHTPAAGDGIGRNEEEEPALASKIGTCLYPLHGNPTTSVTAFCVQQYPSSSPRILLPPGLELSSGESKDRFNFFKTHMLPYCPFFILPNSTTAEKLRLERPFLWICIMAVSPKSTQQQKAFGREIRLILAQKVLFEAEKNLDLLLGLLVYVTWGHPRVKNIPNFTSLVQLAMGILFDLGLNKPPLTERTLMMLEYDSRGCPKRLSSAERTMEERRAVIGCFFASSTISSYFQRADALRWTPYLDECLQLLVEKGDQQNDKLLTNLVRLQLITKKSAETSWHDAIDRSRPGVMPSLFYLRSLQGQLQDIINAVPPEIQQNEILLLHIYSTEVSIHEVAFIKKLAFANGPNFHQIESLYACLQATKKWFDLFNTFPPAGYIAFPLSIFVQLAHCIIALYRLSTFEDAEWDLTLVQETLNFSAVLDQITQKLARVKEEAGLDSDIVEDHHDTFSSTARRFIAVKDWWDARIAEESFRRNDTMADARLDEDPAGFFEDMWLPELLNLGDNQYSQII